MQGKEQFSLGFLRFFLISVVIDTKKLEFQNTLSGTMKKWPFAFPSSYISKKFKNNSVNVRGSRTSLFALGISEVQGVREFQ